MQILLLVSWMTYCIPHESYPGRFSPLVVVLLVLINILLGNKSSDLYWAPNIFIMSNIFQVAFVLSSYCYLLIRIKILRNASVTTGSEDVYMKFQINGIARKTDIICFCISLVLNLISLAYFIAYFAN